MSRELLGIISSEECRKEGAKGWLHLRDFCVHYSKLLHTSELLSDNGTRAIILSILPDADIKSLGNAFDTRIKLASLVAKRELRRVLLFQDPQDLRIERPEDYALLRNCNLHGARICINKTAHLWAEYELAGKIPRAPRTGIDHGPGTETVAFIAHDQEKPRMARIVVKYYDIMRANFPRLIATSGTKRFVERFTRELCGSDHENPIRPVGWDHDRHPGERDEATQLGMGAHGPAGGDVVIAAEIAEVYAEFLPKPEEGPLYHVLFFIDHKHSHPHEPDILVLLKACVDPLRPVNLILNSVMAREWMARYQNSNQRLQRTTGVER